MSEPIRVLQLFTIMNMGGAETMIMNYYRKIDRSKVQFDFMVHRSERGVYDDEIESLGGRIYRMCPVKPQYFKDYKKMVSKFFDEHPEYKIVHSNMSELGYYVFLEAKKRGIPVRICHAHNAPAGKMNITDKAKMLFRNYFKKKIVPLTTDYFMCGYTSGLWLFGEKHKDEFVQFNNAIDAEKFIYKKDVADRIKKELNVEGKFVVGHVGRFAAQKNHGFLIDIFSEIAKQRDDAVLVMCGAGDKDKFKEKVKELGLTDKVIFLEPRQDIYDLVQGFDTFVLPSLFEGLGIVLIEAQAAGLKCFTSADVVPKEPDITGLLTYIPLEDGAKKWADTIISEASDYERKDTYQAILKAGFDIKGNAKWLEEFYLKQHGENE